MGKGKCCNQKCCTIALVVIGAILVIIGGIAVVVFDEIFDQIIVQEGQIEEGNTMYEAWSVVTSPAYMSYYFYNVTNAEEFLGQKKGNYVPPVLKELGPYRFREYLKKDNIDFLEGTDPEQVFFRQTTTYVWDPEGSTGSLDDQITTLNIVAASLVRILEYQLEKVGRTPSRPIYRQINELYNNAGTELLFTHTAQDILFGFYDPLYTEVVELFAGLNVTIPETFGLFSTSNNSAGWFDYTVYTGKKNRPDLINVITSYKSMTKLDYWNSTECNMLNGTDGTTTPPFLTPDRKIYFFVDDVCRSLYSVFEKEETIKKIPAYKYVVPPEVFQCPDKNPDNFCYCPDPDDELCHHDGGLLIEACMAGAPVLISSPHFLYGDGFYFNQSRGISPPNKEEHEATLYYEPNTGTAIQAAKRLQINILLIHNRHIDVLSKIEGKIAFPIVWLNESAIVGQSDADLLYGLLVVPKEVVSILQIVFCIVGAIMFLAPIFYFLFFRYKQKKIDEANAHANVYEIDNKPPTVTRFSSSDNDVFSQENKNPPVYENGHDARFVSAASTSELIQEKM
ncbi:platelet glycoprotein 4-like [Clavelina lepadiformis]|uniref:platelet glycoprotein 4-like n=1 Tax=Clavelina lepadiformis TaxID=159417 RepID=UPI004041DF31